MLLQQSRDVIIRSDRDVVTARALARELATMLGFGPVDQARIATTVSELARNVIAYAGTGQVTLRSLDENQAVGIQIECRDQGPGIGDIAQALGDEAFRVNSVGRGLSGARRLMDEFELQSEVGVGTTVICRKWHTERMKNKK